MEKYRRAILSHIEKELQDPEAGLELYASLPDQLRSKNELRAFERGRGIRRLRNAVFWEQIVAKISFQQINANKDIVPAPKLRPKPPTKKEVPAIASKAELPPELEADIQKQGKLSNELKKQQRLLAELGTANTPDVINKRKPLVQRIDRLGKELTAIQKVVDHWEKEGVYLLTDPEVETLEDLKQKKQNLQTRISKEKKKAREVKKLIERKPIDSAEYKQLLARYQEIEGKWKRLEQEKLLISQNIEALKLKSNQAHANPAENDLSAEKADQ